MASPAKLVKLTQTRRSEVAPAVPREWLSLRELTDYAAVSERTLRAWMHRDKNPLPAVQVEGKILIRRTVFDAWLEWHRIRAEQRVDVDAIVNELTRDLR